MLEWNENVIRRLIKDQIQESLNLEYKRSDSLVNNEGNKREISKDVSAFANSDGGAIVYGVVEDKGVPIQIDDGIEVEGKREWIEQIVNSGITPRMHGVRIFPIDLGKPGRGLFAVEIPVGTTAYQASDFRYYRRFNFQSVPMHDYEVKMIMNRFREPNLQVSFDLREFEDDTATLFVFVKNVGKVTASAAHLRIIMPPKLLDGVEGREWHVTGITTYNDEPVQFLYYNWGGPSKMPFFPGIRYSLSGGEEGDKIRIKIPREFDHTEMNVHFEIYAEDMEPKKGNAIFRSDFTGRASISTNTTS